MLKRIIILACFIPVIIWTGCNSGKNTGRAYYISPDGSDHNEGSSRNPWRSLERVNRMVLNAGDTIFFEAGAEFRGTFYLDSIDSGDPSGKVLIGSYGKGKAIINGGNKEGIRIDNAEYFRIENLIVKGSGRKEGNLSDGVYISKSDSFEIAGLDISGFQHSGLHLSDAHHAVIKEVTCHDNGFAGIFVSGSNANSSSGYDNADIYIGYCKAFNNPGDPTVKNNHSGNGILASAVDGGVIEYCEAWKNGWDMPWTGNGPVGIWIWDCNNVSVQYCIAHDNMTNPAAKDGGGFDLDGGVSNSVIQYCLSYRNQGAGIGLFEFGAAKTWENNVVRYNISYNDGLLNEGSLAVWKDKNAGTMRNCDIYNNTFMNDTLCGVAISFMSNAPSFRFMNNIFIYSGSFTGKGQVMTNESFLGNCYFDPGSKRSFAGYESFKRWISLTGNETDSGKVIGIQVNPGLMSPASKLVTDPTLLGTEAFNLLSPSLNSPVAGKGVDPGSPYGFTNTYKGINGYSTSRDGKHDIGASAAH
ncbi:MAG: right-handed parallel beta-helix repeat-containing protein [Bacteroidales bacterium]